MIRAVAFFLTFSASAEVCAGARVDESALLEQERLHPEDFNAAHLLGEFYVQHQNVAAAIPYLEKAWQIDSWNYVNGYDLALAYLQVGRTRDSRRIVSQLVKQSDKAELHNLLGDIAETEKQVNEAAREYEIAARMDPSEKNLFDLGSDLILHQGFAPALKVFEFGLARYPQSARLRVGLGVVHYSLGQYDEAVESLCQGVDLDPRDTKALYFLGKMYDISPRLAEEVTKRLARFATLYPQNAAANYYYALSLRKHSDSSEAVTQAEAFLRKAIRLNPAFPEAHYELATICEAKSHDTEAVGEYETAVKLDPGLEKAHFRLARLYQKLGKAAEAHQQFRAFEATKAKPSR
jgi:tetratricopeptide (TPR) repeat protein